MRTGDIMVDVKQAIENAKAYAAELLGAQQLLLEEVHSDADHFQITLSFTDRRIEPVQNSIISRQRLREYKTFEVSKKNGEVVGMSIRQMAS
jgi:hypothetical protein